MLPIILDIVAVAILIYMISRGAKRGFAGTVVSFLGYLLAFSAAMFVAKTVSQFIFTQFLRDNMVTSLSAQLNTSDLAASLQGFIDTLPGYVSNAVASAGFETAGLSGSVQNMSATFVDTVVAPVVTGMIRAVIFCILFALCMFLVRRLMRSLRFVNRIPLLGPFNYFLGGVLGFIQGAIVLLVIALLANVALWFFPGDGASSVRLAIEQTYLVKYLFFW
ncbi:CvpA family protein [Candidatus Soleaferrea massiliensis]|uniref:CvpA family protein n=1 Tax=Candidatus Soleaferrea massiliensis TaxID=1470354 RepID=UPI00058D81D0|nr:CvpA family protein [Candidatus Soleaferrea massiliensis]